MLIPSNPPNRREESSSADRKKPDSPPRNDSFRKIQERPPKSQEELAGASQRDNRDSLFELSKKREKVKDESTAKREGASRQVEEQRREHSLERRQDRPSQDQIKGQTRNQQLSTAHKKSPTSSSSSNRPSLDRSEGQTTPLKAKEPVKSSEKDASEESEMLVEGQQMELPKELPEKKPLPGKMEQIRAQQVKTDESMFESKTSKLEKKSDKTKEEATSSAVKAGQERGDMLAANSAINFQTETSQQADIQSSATIQDLATQIIDKIQIMRQGDETKTIVTLRHPPILEGATLTLTTSDNAKREFNISFANLSPDAKAFLDRKLTENSLTETLERKGIVVHMITTTTETELPTGFEPRPTSREQEREQQEERRQQRQRDGEEET